MENTKNDKQCTINDIICIRYLKKIEREKREKQVMLDLWNIATKGKQFILCNIEDYS